MPCPAEHVEELVLSINYINMIKYLFILFFSFSCLEISAQNEEFNKWQISIGGGAALPVSSYKNNDVQNSISVRDSDVLVFEFFDKQDNGSAQPGYYITATVGRVFFHHLLVSLNFDYTQNEVSVEDINAYYDATMNAAYYHIFSQEKYKVSKQYVGIGYYKSNSKWKYSVSSLIGLGNMDFPVYDLQVIRDESWGDRAHTISLHFQNMIDEPKISTFTYGISAEMGITLFKSVFAEIHIKYMLANFEYNIVPRAVAIDARPRQDVVNYRVVDLGLNIGISF